MSLKIDRVQLEIIVRQDKARQRMTELEDAIRKANSQLRKTKKEFGEGSDEYKAQADIIRRLKQEYDDLFEGIGLGHLSLKELTNRQRELNVILRNLDPSLPEWKRYNEQLNAVNTRIKELKGTANDTAFSIGKLNDAFNRYAAIVTTAIAALTGITLTIRKCVDEYAQMEEAESQVTKYTGMTTQEVKRLNEEFKRMDTRTAREELNRLAGEAGKLGITGITEVKEFVDAANMINVALGEDLGEEAVNQIGKLSQMFGDAGRSLKDNMLAVGSAVNQVAQSTSASEPYLVEFTARMGGVGKQAGMAVTDIMGFASTLDQNMLRSEMASTALSGLIMKVYQEPAKYAKLAGMDVQAFTELVKTDVNEAVMSFLSALNRLGGMAQLAPVLKEMQLSGAEAASVISTLAGNVELVRKEQENASQAFKEGTSIINEYNVQNNTVQGRMEKLQAQFKNVRVELGEQLLPVMQYMVSTGSLTVKGIKAAVDIFNEYKGIIITATTALTSYVVATKLATLWETKLKNARIAGTVVTKLQAAADKVQTATTLALTAAKAALTGNIKLATIAWKMFSNVIKTTPIGLVVSLVATLAVGIANLASKARESGAAMRNMFAEMTKEKQGLDTLFRSLENTAEGSERRKELIEQINSKYGEYLPNLLTEKSSLDEIQEAYEQINSAMTANIALKARDSEKEKKTDESIEKQVEKLEDLRESYIKLTGSDVGSAEFIQAIKEMADEAVQSSDNLNKSAWKAYSVLEKSYTGGRKLSWGMKGDIAAFMNDVLTLDNQLDDIDRKYEAWTNKKKSNELPEVEITANRNSPVSGTPGEATNGEDALAALEEQIKQQLQASQEAIKQEKLIMTMAGEDVTEIERVYNEAMYQAEMEYLLKRKAALQAYGQDTTEIQGQIYDKMIAEANRLNDLETRLKQKNQQQQLDSNEQQAEAARRQAKQAFISGDLADEEAYKARLLEIERAYLENRRALLSQFGMDTSQVDGQLLNMDFAAKQGKMREEERNRQTARTEGFAAMENADSFDEKNKLLQQMYDNDLISYQEYQDKKTQLAKQQEEQRKQIAQAAFNAIGQIAGTLSDTFTAMQDAEISKAESRYDKEISEARKAGKDTTKLEEKKEEEINAIKKKYADKQFAANVLQVVSSTAVAAMNAYSAMAGIPVVGPALGAIAAAAAVAAGAVQIAQAKKQRDEAKGLKEGGYSDEYIEGYTAKGNPSDTAGVIPVHKNEFVANHEAVANPNVRQFLDIFDRAQKRGTIRMLNTTQILEQVRTRSGKYEGGYSEENSAASRSSAQPLPGFTAEQRSQVVLLLQENNQLLQVIAQKELIVDPRKMRDSIDRVNWLEKNASR